MKTIIAFVAATATFFLLDMAWLGLVAKEFYRSKLGHLMAADTNWAPAVVFYLIYIAGINYFVVVPAVAAQAWQVALLRGALLGSLCYATYDFTNWATLKDWPWTIVLVDVLWGMALTATTSVVAYWATTLVE